MFLRKQTEPEPVSPVPCTGTRSTRPETNWRFNVEVTVPMAASRGRQHVSNMFGLFDLGEFLLNGHVESNQFYLYGPKLQTHCSNVLYNL